MTKEYAVTFKVQNNYLIKRMKLAGFATASALAEASGVSAGQIGNLLNLKTTGLRADDGWRRTVLKLAETLRCMPQDLIPPDHLRAAFARNTAMIEMDTAQCMLTMSAQLPQIARSPEEELLRDEASQQISQALSALSPRDERIIRLRFGLDGQEPLTNAEVGELLGITAGRAQQLEQRALRLLKHPSRSAKLPHAGEVFSND